MRPSTNDVDGKDAVVARGGFFSRLAGDPPQTLGRLSEAERVRSEVLGATLILPMAIWGVGTATLAKMVGASDWVALVAAIAMALAILIMDRGLMAYISSSGYSHRGATVRILLAVAASAILAHPPMLLFADGTVEDELVQEKQELSEEVLTPLRQRREREWKRVQSKTAHLRESLEAAKEVVRTTVEKRESTRRAILDNHEEADNEALGITGNGAGEGKRYKRLLGERQTLEQQEKALDEELLTQRARVEELEAMLATASDVETPSLDRLDAEIQQLTQEVRDVSHHDPFSRVVALHNAMVRDVRSGDYSLAIVYVLMCCVLLGLELLPLMMKLSFRHGELALSESTTHFCAEVDAQIIKENHAKFTPQLKRLEHMHKMARSKVRAGLRLDEQISDDRLQSLLDRGQRLHDRMEEVWDLADRMQDRGAERRPDDNGPLLLGQRLLARFYSVANDELGSNDEASSAAQEPPPPRSRAS